MRIFVLIILFFVLLLPFAMDMNTVDTHDGYYRDGAIMMLEDHDWLVPKTASGQVRFLKPPLSYWTIALSFSLFGVNLLAARLPSLLAACGTLWITYLFAQFATRSRTAAEIAVMILMSNVLFILSSTYSLPDMWLCLFVTMSLYGFTLLVVEERSTSLGYWMAYGGAAGAVLSKGLLGFGIILLVGVYILWRDGWKGGYRLIHLPIMAVTFLPVIGWFVYIIMTHGHSAWDAFFGDQVANKVRGVWRPLIYTFVYGFMMITCFLPWSATCLEIIVRKWREIKAFLIDQRYHLILIAIFVMLFCFSFALPMRSRYMLPIVPLVSIVIAAILNRFETLLLFFSLRRLVISVWIMFLFLALAILLSASVEAVFIALFMFGMAILLFFIRPRITPYFGIAYYFAITLLLLVGFEAYFMVLRPLIDHREDIYHTPAIVEALQESAVPSKEPILYVGKSLVGSSLLRTSLHGQTKVVSTARFNLSQALNYHVVLLPEDEADELVAYGYQLHPISSLERAPLYAWIVNRTESHVEKHKRSHKKYTLAVHHE